jgi:hypothetical protein
VQVTDQGKISRALEVTRIDHTFAVVGFSCAAALGLYMLWRIARTPGGL